MSLNKVQLIARLGADPEATTLSSGKSVCRLSVATSEKWKDRDGNAQEKTEWHRVVVWGPKGVACSNHLQKGSLVYVEGKLQTRSWEDPQGGKKYTTEIVASDVQFLNKIQSKNEDYGPEPNFDSAEELPF